MKIKLLFLILLLAAFNVLAQNAGDIDTTFNSNDNGFEFGYGANGAVLTTAIQPDGKIIIGGNFTLYNGNSINRIARINTDGSLDTSFVVGIGTNASIRAIAIQSDGKILIGGSFTSYNGTTINGIARLNTNGTLDASFNIGTGFNDLVTSISILPNGNIIVGGAFTLFNGINRNRLAWLNSSGTLGSQFNVLTIANMTIVSSTAIQSDGKIIIGGLFNINNRYNIVRMDTNGTLDTTFNVNSNYIQMNDQIRNIKIQPDGKIIIIGDFNSIIARLNPNGTFDPSFNLVILSSWTVSNISSIAIDSIGKMVCSIRFSNNAKRIVRLNTDGTQDTTFAMADGFSNSISIQSDGKIIIGSFSLSNNLIRNNIARLNTDGTIDLTFNTGMGANGCIASTAIQSNDKILIGGCFSFYNGIPRNHIARLNTDGTLDTLFNIGSGFDGVVKSISIQPDGKIIVGGNFNTYNGIITNGLARLNNDGTLDTSFAIGTGANNWVNAIAIQPDGKIVVGGYFTTFNTTNLNRIARLNTNGTLDTSFTIGTGVDNTIWNISIQPDGKIIIGGSFTSYNGIIREKITRLNGDGTMDTTFVIGTGVIGGNVSSVFIQPDGKIIIGGQFNSYNGITKKKIARLNGDGILDTTFTTGVLGVADVISDITSDSNGKIIIGGRFSNFDNYSGIKKNIARLNTNGTIDTTFIIGTGPNVNVYSITFQSNGKLIIGGDFTGYNGIGRNRIARVFNNCVSPAIDTQTACDSLTWIDGLTYTSSTNTPTFTIVGGAANGCDSVVTLNLTILNSATIDTQIACDSLTWIDNVTYISSTNTPTFTLTNIHGCDSVVTLNLTINNLSASYTSIDNGGGNYTFTNTSTGSFTQTHWAFGDGTTSTLANPTHTFNANGTYVVVLTINDSTTNNTCMDYYLDTLVVTGVVNPVPCAAGFVMYPDGNNNVTVVNSSTGNNLTYFWDFGDGDTSTMQFPSHTYATAGPFYLCLTVNDGVSCVDTYCDSIGINGVVFNKQTGFTINVIAPPVVVGVDEQGTLITDVTIYPNPTKDEFVVELTNFSPSTQINIISVEGKMVYANSSINTSKINVDAANWSRGIYVVKITDKQSSKVMKLIKQ